MMKDLVLAPGQLQQQRGDQTLRKTALAVGPQCWWQELESTGAPQEPPGRKDSFPLGEDRLSGRGEFEVGGAVSGVEVGGHKGLGGGERGGLGMPRSRASGGMCVRL